ncbi:uncharacterized protein LOC121418117 [Lytechinus variegatus]|uniref:uncharacterized protein LOC121418117 n=1 Tax=Lytechinus variegatus TaxID=7654 RepID=UPI001BB223E0|nr:uncharacterized protein LOC121418117 [Lytechinus variegatus]
MENKVKAVISNFTSAIDYAKPPRQEPPVYRAGNEKQDDDKSELMMPRKGGKKGREGETEEKNKKPEFSNDVRSFAIVLMEMMAWLKQKQVDQGLDQDNAVGFKGHILWDKPDQGSVIGARLAGEGFVKSVKGVPSVFYSPNVSQERLDIEAGQLLSDGAGSGKEGTDDRNGTPSPKRIYYANQGYAVEDMRARRAMSDAGVYRKILNKRMDRTNLPPRPKSGVADIPSRENLDSTYVGHAKGKKGGSREDDAERLIKPDDGDAHGYHSNRHGGMVSDYNRNNLTGDGSCLKDNPRLAATFPRRSMMSSEILKSEKRHSLCSSDSGISSPRNSMRSTNKCGQSKKADAHLIELNDRVESALSDSEATRGTAVSKLRGMLDATAQNLKVSEGSTDGDSCHEDDSMIEYGQNFRNNHRRKPKQQHSCPSDTGSDDSKSDVEKSYRSRVKSCDQSDTEKETDYESDRRRGSGDGAETRSTSSLSKFYVRKKSLTPFTAGIPESLTPPCSRPVSRASSAASLLDAQDSCRAKSYYEGSKGQRKFSLGAVKHEGQVYALPSGSAYGYSHATLPKDHPSRSRCRTMDVRSMTLSRTSNIQDHQVVMGRNGWGYSHLVVGGSGVRTLPQAMHNGEHFFIRTVPSGVTKHHVAYSQQLLSALPCLKVGAGQDQLLEVGDTHVAIMEWLVVIRDSDSCLNKQLLNILKACWSREPCPEANDVHCMLDNCVTEVPL